MLEGGRVQSPRGSGLGAAGKAPVQEEQAGSQQGRKTVAGAGVRENEQSIRECQDGAGGWGAPETGGRWD